MTVVNLGRNWSLLCGITIFIVAARRRDALLVWGWEWASAWLTRGFTGLGLGSGWG